MVHKSLSVLVLGVISFLCGLPSAQVSSQEINLAASRVIDLTHAFDQDTVYWPTSPSGFELKPLHKGLTARGFYYSAYAFCAPEHGGTHLDAPVHLAEGVWSGSDIPVERFIGPAFVSDVSEKAKENRDYALTVGDVTQFEAAHGRIPPGAIVLLRTGWGSR